MFVDRTQELRFLNSLLERSTPIQAQLILVLATRFIRANLRYSRRCFKAYPRHKVMSLAPQSICSLMATPSAQNWRRYCLRPQRV